uniref:Uncharacterized protein n=1 Tax=Bracon brevicornis TaxID=1563983 RepID=A0A6V7KNI3_9HYME
MMSLMLISDKTKIQRQQYLQMKRGLAKRSEAEDSGLEIVARNGLARIVRDSVRSTLVGIRGQIHRKTQMQTNSKP